jgi:hypothetical protein
MIEGLIIGGGIAWVIAMIIIYALVDYNWVCCNLNFLQPNIIYHNTKLNYFGVGVVCLALNLFFLPIALCYWFYKLCTVGRK